MERCAVNAQDLGGLLLLHSSTGNRAGMLSLAEDAKKAGRINVAFLSLFVCGKVNARLSRVNISWSACLGLYTCLSVC